MTRRPAGFRRWDVAIGFVFTRLEANGRWVILAGPPDVKLDNKHTDGIPHMHIGGWESMDRRNLRPDLSLREAVDAIRAQLSERAAIDAEKLARELA